MHSGFWEEGGIFLNSPKWVEVLIKSGLQAVWVTELHQSLVGNFTIPRAGAFAREDLDAANLHLSMMVMARCPVWI